MAVPATSQTVVNNPQTGNSSDPTVTTVNGVMTVDNTQTNSGVIFADAPLNVVENDGLVQATSDATGNSLQGGNQAADATLTSSQINHGNITSHAIINGTNTGAEDLSLGTPAYATTQAIGNYAASTSTAGNLTANMAQTSDAAHVAATTEVIAPNNAIYVSGEGDATTEVNHIAYEVSQGRLDSTATQISSTATAANVSTTIHYSPSPNSYSASATNNYYGAYSGDRGSQDHDITQTSSAMTQARAEVYGGNTWTVMSNSTAVANNVNLENTGGSLAVTNHQTQSGPVLSQAVIETDQFGSAYATASGIGNQLAAGNNDITVRVDNTQISTGGVDVTASFEGNTGYDAYITADAVGNQALAYACSECRADMGVTSDQTNNSDVNATATATVNNQGRAIVSAAHATGNSATWYVSGNK